MKIPEELLPVVEWWEKNGKQALMTLAIAGLIGLAYWSWTSRRERARDAAADAMAAAVGSAIQVQMDAKSPAAVSAIENLNAAISAYGDSKTGPILKLTLAADYFARKDEGDVKNALDIYEALIADKSTPAVYKDIPVVGKAQCLEALGKFDEALKAFDAFVEQNADSYLALTAKLGAARCLAQAGDKAQAIARLEALKEEKGVDQGAVEFTLALVKRWVPQDARTPAPVKEQVPSSQSLVPSEDKEAETPAPEAAPSTAEQAPAPAPAPVTEPAPSTKD